MHFRKSTRKVSWLTLAKVGVIIMICWFAYWAFIWEMLVWHKSVIEAFNSASVNWVLFVASVILFEELVWFGHHRNSKHALSWKLSSVKVPSIATATPQVVDEPLILIDEKMIEQAHPMPSSNSFSFGSPKKPRRKLHIPFLYRGKRIFAGCLVLLYVLLAASAFYIGNLIFILFVGTAYILFDGLRKTRRAKWEKPKQ